MKADKQSQAGLLPGLLKGLTDRPEANMKPQEPTIGNTPVQAPALYEDSGEGYNSNFDFPQE